MFCLVVSWVINFSAWFVPRLAPMYAPIMVGTPMVNMDVVTASGPKYGELGSKLPVKYVAGIPTRQPKRTNLAKVLLWRSLALEFMSSRIFSLLPCGVPSTSFLVWVITRSRFSRLLMAGPCYYLERDLSIFIFFGSVFLIYFVDIFFGQSTGIFWFGPFFEVFRSGRWTVLAG